MSRNTDNRINEQNSPAAASCGIVAPQGDEIVATDEECLMPVGFRFAPTDAELIDNYLMKKVNNKRLPPNDNIHEANLYETEPAQLTQKYKRSDGGNEWFFFTTRNKKYPNGVKPNRATGDGIGYWKLTGDAKPVVRSGQTEIIGYKRNLDFFKGRYPGGERSRWKMHEYKVKDGGIESGFASWVMCKIYVTRNKKGDISQAAAGASSTVQPSMTWNNNTVDATWSAIRFSSQNRDVSSSRQDHNGMSLMEVTHDDNGPSRGIRPTHFSHEHYFNASFSELDTNGASLMSGSCKKRVDESSSMEENRNKMHASLNPLMPDVPSRRLRTSSSQQDVNRESPMAGNKDTMYPSAPAPLTGSDWSEKNNTLYASQNPLMEVVSAFFPIQDASTQVVNIVDNEEEEEDEDENLDCYM